MQRDTARNRAALQAWARAAWEADDRARRQVELGEVPIVVGFVVLHDRTGGDCRREERQDKLLDRFGIARGDLVDDSRRLDAEIIVDGECDRHDGLGGHVAVVRRLVDHHPRSLVSRGANLVTNGLPVPESFGVVEVEPERRGLLDTEGRCEPGPSRLEFEGGRGPGFADEEPCPALDPELKTCDVYESRPITCRIFGPAVRSGGDILGVCELNYVGATDAQIAACQVEVDAQGLEDDLLNGDCRQTIVAFALNEPRPLGSDL